MKVASILRRSALAALMIAAGFEALRSRDASTPPPAPVARPAIAAASAPAAPSCKTDWKLCADNADLANNWKGYVGVRSACKRAAEKAARYGAPEWPWLAFASFKPGTQSPRVGVVILYEDDARFPNAFNAKVRSRATCTYDLNAGEVLGVEVTAR
jgi:hypothetical protein